jgi:cysteine-rich repeat protein
VDAAVTQADTTGDDAGKVAPGADSAAVTADAAPQRGVDSGMAGGGEADAGNAEEACGRVCPGSGECREGVCRGGSCGFNNLPAHTPCTAGVCDGSGSCIKCVDNSDCTAPGLRACHDHQCVACNDASHCDASKREVCNAHLCEVGPYCGDRSINQPTEQCDDGNTSSGDACINCRSARCGDGYQYLQVEECDPTVAPHNPWTCNAATCKISREYSACRDDGDCPPSPWQCLNGRCTKMCTNFGECPPVPTGGGSTGCGFFCVNYCQVDADCAPFHFCFRMSNQPTSSAGLCAPRPCTDGCATGTSCQDGLCLPL